MPSGGHYIAGNGNISSATSGVTVNQNSSRGIIDWHNFSIGQGGIVQFNNGKGATLNRVTGEQATAIQGRLGATGSIFLINPNGVVIGQNGQVVTGGSFVASTRDVSNANFMQSGDLQFAGNSSGKVVNKGHILSDKGNVVLIGASVENKGTISSGQGTVALAAGDTVMLKESSGPDSLYIVVKGNGQGNVLNTGDIRAAAAKLEAARGNVYALAGNHQGLIQAAGTSQVNGQVWLTAPQGKVVVKDTVISAHNVSGSGGSVTANGHDVIIGQNGTIDVSAVQGGKNGGRILVGVDGAGGAHLARTTHIAAGASLKASGKESGQGGFIETSGHNLQVDKAVIDAGKGGNWFLDPDDLTIDANAAGTISSALNAGTNVSEQTTATVSSGVGNVSAGQGDITLAAPISWGSDATLALSAWRNVNVNAPVTISGNGTLNITTNGAGATANPGGLNFAGGSVHFTAPVGGALLINAQPYTLVRDVASLQNVQDTGYYALANNIDVSSATGFTPIAQDGFTGTFNGLGNTLSNLNINSNAYSVGLFGQIASGGLVTDLHMNNAQVSGSGSYTGALAGMNSGTIANSSVSGSINAAVSGVPALVGGLVGYTTGVLSNIYSSMTISVSGDTANVVGGVTGWNTGSINGSTTTGNTSVQGSGSNIVGGFAGQNDGQITQSSAAGSVTFAADSANGVSVPSTIGGFAGYNTGTIDHVFASGAVSNQGTGSTSNTGGLVGWNVSGTIMNASAAGNVSGTDNTSIGGLVGENDASLQNIAASGAVSNLTSGANAGNIGGLVGLSIVGATIDGAQATGAVSGNNNTNMGGLVGYSIGSVSNSSASGTVSGHDNAQFGGLIGFNEGAVSNVSAYGHVMGDSSAQDIKSAGGLIGLNSGTVTVASASGAVDGRDIDNLGGLIGNNKGSITAAYATGAVNDMTSLIPVASVGGLVGWNWDVGILNSVYATGKTSVTNNGIVGGLVGENNGSVTDAYATGTVSGAGNSLVGAISGENTAHFQGVYFNTDTSVVSSSIGTGSKQGIQGLTTAQWVLNGPMVSGSRNQFSTPSAWVSGSPYPILRALPYITVAGGLARVYGTNTQSNTTTTAVDQNGKNVVSLLNTSSLVWTQYGTSSTNVGQYGGISGAGVTAPQGYQVTYSGVLNITPALLTVTALSQSGLFATVPTLNANGFVVYGLSNGDTVTGAHLSTNASQFSSPLLIYNIFVDSIQGRGIGNYNIQYNKGNYTISPFYYGVPIFWPESADVSNLQSMMHRPSTAHQCVTAPVVSNAPDVFSKYPTNPCAEIKVQLPSYSDHLGEKF
ncbi:beta strand repeat-containing protein [Neokomagataea thailandica]|uniref:beta strand repeat-containing protein n=1 Tax=Neokomagataea TaxID=1223423 RepID=UPI001471FB29|nr:MULTISPECIES: GLUG motif-containing protein [Neokomagataea]